MNNRQKIHNEILEYCPACRCEKIAPFLHSNDKEIFRCTNCNLLFVSPRPSEQSIQRLFVDEYIDTDTRIDEDFTAWRQSSLLREATILQNLYPDGGRLLDLGTASGVFLGAFSHLNSWMVEGVEPSRFAAAIAAKRYKVSVHPGFLRDQGFDNECFDVITSLDAFYFHPDPRADLAEITRILKYGGLFAIEIPGLRFRLLKNTGLICRLIYGVSARLNAGIHLFYYSRKSLGQLVVPFGFKEIASFPEQSPLYGAWYSKVGNYIYYWISAMLYRMSNGYFNIAPKEFIIYKKVDK